MGWRWEARNIWNICTEWRQRLSWLRAYREEKVGLVKAQYPTAQTLPSLYHQSNNTSQYLSHSDSDLQLDAQAYILLSLKIQRNFFRLNCQTLSYCANDVPQKMLTLPDRTLGTRQFADGMNFSSLHFLDTKISPCLNLEPSTLKVPTWK
ncbi:hypothetical protein PV328_001048 [Microctonus aethiopoides]|uniref:Uncharacterized protein n=1 Tax=Microctonus aethiopoides TaxID=144406 RepID=A0AA39KX34_9HYME|nr:hypothetical protein PV328_001048 [Microctonus aethiopoides]